MAVPAPTAPRPALAELPLGAVRPAGWLLDQLRLQAAGQTGRLPEVWGDVGPDSAWLGGGGEDWERGPYFLDGLLPLAHLLEDEALLTTAKTWVEALLAGQQPSGQFGPTTNDDWWPRMVACKVLTQHADATGDERVLTFLERYFAFQARELPSRPLTSWGHTRGADAVLSVLWLHERTGAPELLDLSRLLLQQTADWYGHLTDALRPTPTATFSHLDHCVSVAMGLKTEAVRWLLDGDPARPTRSAEQAAALDRAHGMVHGSFSGDEWLAGRDPHHGVETCEVVEHMFTAQQLVRIFGDGAHADALELLAYNLLAAANDPRMLAHQYHQQANQVRVTVEPRDWTYSSDDANLFGLEPHFGCCTANLHQGWPKFVRSLWMTTPDGGVAAVAYAPCTVSTTTASGQRVDLEVATSYPFEEAVRITVGTAGAYPIRLRVPAWCTAARLTVTGIEVPADADAAGWVVLSRSWRAGDVIDLVLPMAVRTVPRDRGAVGLRLGPLVLVHSPGEDWWPVPGAPGLGEWHLTPRTSWNKGVLLESAQAPNGWPVRRRPVGPVPFELAGVPVEVRAQGATVRQWVLEEASAGRLPDSPVRSTAPVEDLRLVPYGSARIRVAELPVVVPDEHVGMATG